MRSPTINTNHQSSSIEINSNKQPTNNNLGNINNQLKDYSLSQLQQITAHQQEQIEHNQQLLLAREQRLKYLRQQQRTKQENLLIKQRFEQHEMKCLRLKTLQQQINQQKTSNSTFDDELEVLKQIFLNKEDELIKSCQKVDELTKQLEQIRRLKLTTNKDQSQNKNELEKLKQELLIRNKLNEQQNRKITYQRDIFASKQVELNQLNRRIEEIQQHLKKKKLPPATIIQPVTSSIGFKDALDSVQNTLNNINIAEIEKRMVQLANSFNSINTNESPLISQNDQTKNSNSPKKINSPSPSVPSSKITFASKDEIVATYIPRSSDSSISSSTSLQLSDLPINLHESTTDTIDSSSFKTEDQSLPVNLRLNDDILSIHFNNITSNIKKRHSLSDPCDSLIKYLPPTIEEQPPVQVRDDSITSLSLLDSKPIVLTYENLLDFQSSISDSITDELDGAKDQQQTIIESFISDTESDSSFSEDIDSTISFQTILSTSITNLKSLLKTPTTPKNTSRRVVFDPLALLLDAAVLGELDLVIKSAQKVENVSQPNDEGLTALHNAVCAANFACVKYLVEFGCDINYADNDGWTPLHCAASCNNTSIVQFLIEHGACIYATTIRDIETAANKCEVEEENFIHCSEYLLKVQNDFGVINNGLVYALYDYDPDLSAMNELEFKDGDQLRILRRGDENEHEWWWAKHENTEKEGYVPRNYLGLYPRVRLGTMISTGC